MAIQNNNNNLKMYEKGVKTYDPLKISIRITIYASLHQVP